MKTNLFGRSSVVFGIVLVLGLSGCKPRETNSTVAPSPVGGGGTGTAKAPVGPPPSFSLAWSEYPSWSVFGVASQLKWIDGAKGKLGPIELKWGVDIELKEAEYDPCLQMYGSGNCDAVCITTLDALSPALTRPSVVVLPTSTSAGADALIVSDAIKSVADLRGRKVYGLAKSVSEYCFARNLQVMGLKDSDFTFANMDPGAAAVAMQQKQAGVDAIMVWNPFVLETLNKRSDTHVLFDSSTIPGEIIDSVTVAQASLAKPGGKEFACAVIETFYAVNQRLADPRLRDDTLVALGEKFSHLDLAGMRKVVEQTRFYGTPEAGLAVLLGGSTRETMNKVTDFCVRQDLVKTAPKIGYGSPAEAPGSALRFDPSYIQWVITHP
jgi:NitT/TauT family transport system substrate-binding protein